MREKLPFPTAADEFPTDAFHYMEHSGTAVVSMERQKLSVATLAESRDHHEINSSSDTCSIGWRHSPCFLSAERKPLRYPQIGASRTLSRVITSRHSGALSTYS